MLLLVGLGNPGSNYTNTRHNIGFKIIDAINLHFKLSKQKPKFKGLLTTGNIESKKIYAIKPLTFMNNSGTAIKELIDYFKIEAKDVFVFHDDMDIDFGKIKAKFGGTRQGCYCERDLLCEGPEFSSASSVHISPPPVP